MPILLGLSLIVVSHPPPIGPIGLACFAGAAALIARTQRLRHEGNSDEHTRHTDRARPHRGSGSGR